MARKALVWKKRPAHWPDLDAPDAPEELLAPCETVWGTFYLEKKGGSWLSRTEPRPGSLPLARMTLKRKYRSR